MTTAIWALLLLHNLHLDPGIPGVGGLAVLDEVVAFELCLLVHAVLPEQLEGQEDDEGEDEGPDDDGHHAKKIDPEGSPRQRIANGVDNAGIIIWKQLEQIPLQFLIQGQSQHHTTTLFSAFPTCIVAKDRNAKNSNNSSSTVDSYSIQRIIQAKPTNIPLIISYYLCKIPHAAYLLEHSVVACREGKAANNANDNGGPGLILVAATTHRYLGIE